MAPNLMILVIVASVIGAGAGLFTGLMPGIHVNTLASVMLVSYPTISSAASAFADPSYVPILVAACIMSASVVHSFVDFVPSVFIGAPNPDDVLSMLPGHRLLMDGYGMVAVRSAAIGSAIGASCAVLLAIPLQYLMINGLAEHLDKMTFAVVLFALILIILADKRKIWALILVLTSGALGLLCMDFGIPCSGIFGEGTLLFPLLSGLFGMPALLESVKNARIPPQRDDFRDPVGIRPGIKGVLIGAIAGWYPGITATAGASLASVFMPEKGPSGFISLTASIGTVTTVFSLISLSVSGSGRSGTVIVIRDIIGGDASGFCSEAFVILLLSVAIAAALGYWMTIASGKFMSKIADRVDLRRMNKAVIVLIAGLVLLMTGPWGLAVLAVSTLVGFIPIVIGMGRIPLSGCLMLPVILHYII